MLNVLSKLVLSSSSLVELKDKTAVAPDAPVEALENLSRAVSRSLFMPLSDSVPPLAMNLHKEIGSLLTKVNFPIPLVMRSSKRMLNIAGLRVLLDKIENVHKCAISWPVVCLPGKTAGVAYELQFTIRWEASAAAASSSAPRSLKARRYMAPKVIPPPLLLERQQHPSNPQAPVRPRFVKRPLDQSTTTGGETYLEDIAESEVADVVTDICGSFGLSHGHPLYYTTRDRLEYAMDVMRRISVSTKNHLDADDDDTVMQGKKSKTNEAAAAASAAAVSESTLRLCRSADTSGAGIPLVVFLVLPFNAAVGVSALPKTMRQVEGAGVFLDTSSMTWVCAVSTGVDPRTEDIFVLATRAEQISVSGL